MAVTIVTRAGKGSPLTHDQVDANFNNLNSGKDDTVNNLPLDTTMSSTADFIPFYDAAAAAVKKITPINSVFFNRTVIIKVLPDSIPTYVGNGISAFTIPLALNGLVLSATAGDLGAHVYTAGVTGTTDIMLHNLTQAVDMLTTAITIDSGETDSSTAASAPVVDGSNNTVATADVIRFDIDAVSSGTAANGLEIRMQFKGA
tara:strand:+ start:1429 stop:2034 length:606 start_codon:yes stop_codon:yes gene_type:complete